MNANKLDLNAIYRSNDGMGPDSARIIRVTDKTVIMERWGRFNRSRKGRKKFELPLDFFLEEKSGWVRSNLQMSGER